MVRDADALLAHDPGIRIDPAAGLFGLAIVRRDGFLADAANRAKSRFLAMASH